MAEDVNLQSSGYDEDLCENPFFKYMQTKQKQLYDEVTSKRWTVSLTFCYISPRVLSKNMQNFFFELAGTAISNSDFRPAFVCFQALYLKVSPTQHLKISKLLCSSMLNE